MNYLPDLQAMLDKMEQEREETEYWAELDRKLREDAIKEQQDGSKEVAGKV